MQKILIVDNKKLIVSKYLRIIDKIMVPLMFILGGFKLDSIQETHPRHCINVDGKDIDDNLCFSLICNGKSWVKGTWYGLNHMPIFGGWKDYVILQSINNIDFWFIGRKTNNGKNCQVHKLPIKGNLIKMLKGSDGNVIYFFGIDKYGNQIPIKLVDEGKIGDKKYKNVRLF